MGRNGRSAQPSNAYASRRFCTLWAGPAYGDRQGRTHSLLGDAIVSRNPDRPRAGMVDRRLCTCGHRSRSMTEAIVLTALTGVAVCGPGWCRQDRHCVAVGDSTPQGNVYVAHECASSEIIDRRRPMSITRRRPRSGSPKSGLHRVSPTRWAAHRDIAEHSRRAAGQLIVRSQCLPYLPRF